jgi:hypothetical protein
MGGGGPAGTAHQWVARAMGAGGVFFWMYGPSGPGTWGVLGDTVRVAAASRPRAAGGL